MRFGRAVHWWWLTMTSVTAPVAFHHVVAADHDLADLTRGHLVVLVIDQLHPGARPAVLAGVWPTWPAA